ncbi:MAG: branched-chain amino acid ABC transporter permease [SAR324 cluster bacterium]|nr:branched-chain amino acid ABC transporter permease [SAR324 cluster bacterium]
MALKDRKKILTVMIVMALVGLFTPFANDFIRLLITQTLVLGILALSVDLLLGFTGLASLGQAAYLGMGAYLTAILVDRFQFGLGCDLSLILLMGIAIGAAGAAFFGLFAIRATGVYFLIITLALGMVVWGLANRWNSLTGGDNGINVMMRPNCGVDFSNDINFFLLVYIFFCLSLTAMYVLVNSPFGRTLVGIRESETRMRMLGYNTWLHKYLAFVIAGGFGGLAGVFWTHLNGIVSPEDVLLPISVDALLMVVLGGAGTLVGGPIGAAVVVFIREYLSTLVEWWQYILGGVYVLTILFLPDGLMGLMALVKTWRTDRSEKEGAEASSGQVR